MNEYERGVAVPNRGYPLFEQLLSERPSFGKIIDEIESCFPQDNHYGGISFVMKYNNDVANVRMFLNFNDLIDIHANDSKWTNLLISDVKNLLDQFEYRTKLDLAVYSFPKDEEE